MNSLKAIISGVVFIVVAILLVQLAYLFIAIGYHNLAKTYPYLNEIAGVFRYLIAIPVILFIAFIGGYLTAVISPKYVLLHCLIVGFITIGGMMWMALNNAELTMKGYVINALMLGAIVAGGFYQMRKNRSLKGLDQRSLDESSNE